MGAKDIDYEKEDLRRIIIRCARCDLELSNETFNVVLKVYPKLYSEDCPNCKVKEYILRLETKLNGYTTRWKEFLLVPTTKKEFTIEVFVEEKFPECYKMGFKIRKREKEEFEKYNREKALKYYNENKDNPEFKERIIEIKKAYRERHKDNPEFIDKRNKDQREWYQKNKDNPEFMERKREIRRKSYQKYKDTPEFKDKRRENNKGKSAYKIKDELADALRKEWSERYPEQTNRSITSIVKELLNKYLEKARDNGK